MTALDVGPAFYNIQPGDTVHWVDRFGVPRRAKVNPLLIFPGHVVVNHGPCGTVVDDSNYTHHTRTRRTS